MWENLITASTKSRFYAPLLFINKHRADEEFSDELNKRNVNCALATITLGM